MHLPILSSFSSSLPLPKPPPEKRGGTDNFMLFLSIESRGMSPDIRKMSEYVGHISGREVIFQERGFPMSL